MEQLVTIRDWLRHAVSRFNQAGLVFGHGAQQAFDEAAYLILHTLHLPPDRLEPFLDARLLPPEREAVAQVLRQRIDERMPAAYITGEAWLGDFRFHVDPRVIVPRSYIAELLDDALAPWVPDPSEVERALDLCTGSGCLAILLAHAFPNARIDAVDVSADALEVARRNVQDYDLAGRIEIIRGDLFSAVPARRYDLIVCNPPYVIEAAMRELPPEYRHEPALALDGGEDGMRYVRRVVREARAQLTPRGLLVVEVGHNADVVEAAFPDLHLTWLNAQAAERSVFLAQASDLLG